MKIVPEIAALDTEMRDWRHHIHARPETAFEEVETSRFVAEKLESFGLEVHRGMAKTGRCRHIAQWRVDGSRRPARRP